MQYIIGIDEAGRGPWAGPVVVGGWLCAIERYEDNKNNMHGLGDSKRVKVQVRESLFLSIIQMQEQNLCQYAFAYRDAHEIDAYGIREANRLCMQDVLVSLLNFVTDQDEVQIYIDGSDNYLFDISNTSYTFAKKRNSKKLFPIQDRKPWHISYIIGGDASIGAISLASIVAKVTRDAMMCEYNVDFPEYGFSSNKGYGTAYHQEQLTRYGPSPIHRRSYMPVKKLIFPNLSIE